MGRQSPRLQEDAEPPLGPSRAWASRHQPGADAHVPPDYGRRIPPHRRSGIVPTSPRDVEQPTTELDLWLRVILRKHQDGLVGRPTGRYLSGCTRMRNSGDRTGRQNGYEPCRSLREIRRPPHRRVSFDRPRGPNPPNCQIAHNTPLLVYPSVAHNRHYVLPPKPRTLSLIGVTMSPTIASHLDSKPTYCVRNPVAITRRRRIVFPSRKNGRIRFVLNPVFRSELRKSHKKGRVYLDDRLPV